jgi:hypothetical protein
MPGKEDSFEEPTESPAEVADPEIIGYTPGALKMLDGIEREVIALQNSHDDQRLDGMFSRSREIAMRIALIVTLSRDKSKVDEVSLKWAWDYVIFYTKEMVVNVKRMMGATKLTRTAEHLADAIFEAGKKGMTPRDMGRFDAEFKRLEKRQTEEVMHLLKSQHEVVLVQVKQSKGGRPTERYMHKSFLPDS